MIARRVGSSRWTSSSHERQPGASMMRAMTWRRKSRSAAAFSGVAWNSFIRVIVMSGCSATTLLRTLALRAHSAPFRSLRQHPFGEVKALLRLAQLLPQLAHLGFERFERFERFGPSRELAPAATLPQALGPEPERQRERRVNRGMPRLGLPGREAGSDQVDDAQDDGDRVPNRGLEGQERSFRKQRTRPTSIKPTAW